MSKTVYRTNFDPDDWFGDFSVRQNDDGSKSFLIRCNPFLMRGVKESINGLPLDLSLKSKPRGLSLNGSKILQALSVNFTSIKEVRFMTNMITIYLHDKHSDDEDLWQKIVDFLREKHNNGNLTEPQLFSESQFARIVIMIPSKFVKETGYKSMHFNFFRLLREADGEEIIRLADIQLGCCNEDENVCDRILITMAKQVRKKSIAQELSKFSQLQEDNQFIVPVYRDDYLACENGPEIRVFSYQINSNSLLGISLPRETIFKKGSLVSIIKKGQLVATQRA